MPDVPLVRVKLIPDAQGFRACGAGGCLMPSLRQGLAYERCLIGEVQDEKRLIRDRLLTCASFPRGRTTKNDINKQPLILGLTFPSALEKRPPSWGRAGSR